MNAIKVIITISEKILSVNIEFWSLLDRTFFEYLGANGITFSALVVDELLKNLDTKTPIKMQDMIAKGIE